MVTALNPTLTHSRLKQNTKHTEVQSQHTCLHTPVLMQTISKEAWSQQRTETHTHTLQKITNKPAQFVTARCCLREKIKLISAAGCGKPTAKPQLTRMNRSILISGGARRCTHTHSARSMTHRKTHSMMCMAVLPHRHQCSDLRLPKVLSTVFSVAELA